VREARFLNLA